ncbi:hypothetical protein OIU92_00115 [Escherichia coli]|nr:hypothetical protein [Escherichia coli]
MANAGRTGLTGTKDRHGNQSLLRGEGHLPESIQYIVENRGASVHRWIMPAS